MRALRAGRHYDSSGPTCTLLLTAGASEPGRARTVAAELAFARLEIAALQHDNAVLASENRVLANARNLPEVVADVREYIRHVVDGDDAVPCKPEV